MPCGFHVASTCLPCISSMQANIRLLPLPRWLPAAAWNTLNKRRSLRLRGITTSPKIPRKVNCDELDMSSDGIFKYINYSILNRQKLVTYPLQMLRFPCQCRFGCVYYLLSRQVKGSRRWFGNFQFWVSVYQAHGYLVSILLLIFVNRCL